MFPEKDNSCHVEIRQSEHDSVLCRNPVVGEGTQTSEMMTLESFLDGGHEVPGSRILVCVKSLGQRKRSEIINSYLHLRLTLTAFV